MGIKKLMFFLFISGNAAFAQHTDPPQDASGKYETILDSTAFSSAKAFEQQWNNFYPWGTDHNGSARMYKKQIILKDGVLELKATRLRKNEGKSKLDPYLPINYHAGAVHAKHQIAITKAYPEYIVSGEFKAPIAAGTWPAFWLTAVNGWPPETDILEFKGDDVNWQNTFITPKDVITIKKNIPDAHQQWHSYTAVLQRLDEEKTLITYYIDGEKMGTHDSNFTNKPLWLIVNLQMEGSSGPKGPEQETSYYARKITVKRLKAVQ
jgi:beta-glucanase (GH16 family)